MRPHEYSEHSEVWTYYNKFPPGTMACYSFHTYRSYDEKWVGDE